MNEREARELVPEYVLGILAEPDRRAMAALVASSAELSEEVRSAEVALDRVADSLPPATSSASARGRGRDRLLATLGGPERFREFFPLLRDWFDLGDDALRAVLARVDGGAPTGLTIPDAPGVRYFHFQGGPGARSLESGCVILVPGARFPRHVHDGAERSMVLQGSLLLDGHTYHPGAVIEVGAGTSHDFGAGAGRDLIVIVGHDGIRF
jgi:putative transcriptional regulator